MKHNFSEKNWRSSPRTYHHIQKNRLQYHLFFQLANRPSYTENFWWRKMLLNSITIKPLTQKDSVEISLESINNNGITKNNAREVRAISTNTTEINKDICDTQNNIVVDHIKMIQRKFMVTSFTIICWKTQDKETTVSLIRAPKCQ